MFFFAPRVLVLRQRPLLAPKMRFLNICVTLLSALSFTLAPVGAASAPAPVDPSKLDIGAIINLLGVQLVTKIHTVITVSLILCPSVARLTYIQVGHLDH